MRQPFYFPIIDARNTDILSVLIKTDKMSVLQNKTSLKKGTIIKSTGKWYAVRLEDGQPIDCRIKGKLRLNELKLTNPIAVGDMVMLEKEEGLDTGIITKILPRDNYVARQSPRKKHFLHLLCANIDQAMVITTIRQPHLKPGFIDRFLLTTTPQSIPTIIVVNKSDLWEEEDEEIFGGVKAIYEPLGYPVIGVSGLRGDGIDEFRAHLKDKLTFVSGHSGVGKSTLVNAVQPNLELITNDISDYSGKGQHTTTFAEMHDLDFGGQIIDTPGIKELAFINMEPHDVAHNFVEFFKVLQHCKYNDCLHINEPHCAVKAAVEEGSISIIRYQNYLDVVGDIQNQNHWERETDW